MPAPPGWKNKLYFGDNLKILAKEIESESVDLVYIDPPFNSNANYNVLFAESTGEQSAAQITAFEDTWHWGRESEELYREAVLEGGRLSNMLQAMRAFLGQSDMMAYLVMMAPRLQELNRVLRPSGSIYLHCDPTASHYLKLLLDAIFDPPNFRNEIVWQRTSAHNDPKRYGRVHDVLLYYAKSEKCKWNQQYSPLTDDNFLSHDFEVDEEGRKYRKRDLTAPAHGHTSGQYVWKGKRPSKGRMWSYTEANMRRLEEEGRIVYTNTGMPRLKIYVEDLRGISYQDVWARPELWLNSAANERLGYPTQKPESLLERIIRSSSSKGDVVLDAFCGCGTAVAVAERLDRRWIGIDITHLAIALIRHRLFGFRSKLAPYTIEGRYPKDLANARELAKLDRHQFELWASGMIGAKPTHETKKGADRGIDAVIPFAIDNSGMARKAVVQVKSGHVKRSDISTLNHDRMREKAEVGVFLTLEQPTREMKKEGLAAGFYQFDYGAPIPRIQILTIAEILDGDLPKLPGWATLQTYKKPPTREKAEAAVQGELFRQASSDA